MASLLIQKMRILPANGVVLVEGGGISYISVVTAGHSNGVIGVMEAAIDVSIRVYRNVIVKGAVSAGDVREVSSREGRVDGVFIGEDGERKGEDTVVTRVSMIMRQKTYKRMVR